MTAQSSVLGTGPLHSTVTRCLALAYLYIGIEAVVVEDAANCAVRVVWTRQLHWAWLLGWVNTAMYKPNGTAVDKAKEE